MTSVHTLRCSLLARWFQAHFPYHRGECGLCGERGAFMGVTRASSMECGCGAARVELNYCDACNQIARFPRYNLAVRPHTDPDTPGAIAHRPDPSLEPNPFALWLQSKILQTRQGRCGEYAALLLKMVLALGWRARWVSPVGSEPMPTISFARPLPSGIRSTCGLIGT